MVRHYYRYDDMGAMAPKFPGSFENAQKSQRRGVKNEEPKHEEIKDEKREDKQPKKTGFNLPVRLPFLKDGMGGFDDMLLIFLIVMLLSADDRDMPLILALGYIFISKDGE